MGFIRMRSVHHQQSRHTVTATIRRRRPIRPKDWRLWTPSYCLRLRYKFGRLGKRGEGSPRVVFSGGRLGDEFEMEWQHARSKPKHGWFTVTLNGLGCYGWLCFSSYFSARFLDLSCAYVWHLHTGSLYYWMEIVLMKYIWQGYRFHKQISLPLLHTFRLRRSLRQRIDLFQAVTSSDIGSCALSCADTSSMAAFNWAILSARFCFVTSGSIFSSSSKKRGSLSLWSSPNSVLEICGANTKPNTPQTTPPTTKPDQKLPLPRSALK